MPVKTQTIPSTSQPSQTTYTKKEIRVALARSRESIFKGSKSFSLASYLFKPSTRQAAFALYGWCRYCDDQIDNDSDNKEEKLSKLIELTKASYAGKKMTDPVFVAFQYVTFKYKIPMEYPLELLEGMAMDVRGQSFNSIGELLIYCYRVAGTVGLMMSHIMGISDERALMHAANLGKAMQLTNIARDVMEDAERGRIYLPLDWMRELELGPNQIQNPENKLKVASLVKRILAVAAVLYQSGDQGLKYLSVREACAIASARLIYSEIGFKVSKLQDRAWDQRTFVTFKRKTWLIFKATLKVILASPGRLRKPWRAIPIRIIWKNT